MTNKSDLIREFIRTLFDSNHDFSNRELNKTKFKEYFETDEKKALDISWAKHQTLFIDQMQVVAKEKKIDVRTYGYGGKKERIKNLSMDGTIKSTIQPKPKGGFEQIQPQNNLQSVTSNGLQQQPQQDQKIITPLTDDEALKLTTILCRSFGGAVHRLKPDFKEFDDAEALELGTAWMPLAKPFLEKYGGQLFTAIVVTVGVLGREDRPSAFKPKQKGDKTQEDKREEKSQPPASNDGNSFADWQARVQN